MQDGIRMKFASDGSDKYVMTRSKASGRTPRQIFVKMKKLSIIDVKIPTTDGREIMMRRYGEPMDVVALVLSQLGLRIPPQSPPYIREHFGIDMPVRTVGK